MELIGVVPSVDIIEKATPSDIINKPITNKQILLSIILNISHIFFKPTAHINLMQITSNQVKSFNCT